MSSRTLRAASVKTVSARRHLFWIAVPLLLLALIASFPVAKRQYSCMRYQANPGYRTDKNITVAGEMLKAEEASSPSDLAKGLSGRPCIHDDQAMLFTFPRDHTSEHCFWMKDMLFPIDIIWLDQEKRVVFSATGLSPKTYPKQYCPNMPTLYVLELRSGRAQELGIVYDKQLTF